jgi:hypothetical protein
VTPAGQRHRGRYPYIQVVRNDKLDVEAIPHFAG